MALTETALTKLKPKAKPYSINDISGLSIYVSPSGTKNWHFRYSWEKKQSRLSLGIYPSISLKNARIQCDSMHSLLVQGINPKFQKQVKTDKLGL